MVAGSALTFDGSILATPTLNLTNALGVAYGGTGQTTANAGLNALLPAQTGNATKYLQTDGSNTTWDAVSISTADITGTLPVANGGTGQTTANTAFNALAPSQTSNANKYLKTDGTNTSWATVDALPSQTGNANKYLKTDGTTATWETVVTGGGPITQNADSVSTNQTIAAGSNGFSVGPMTIQSGYSVNIASGQRWVVI